MNRQFLFRQNHIKQAKSTVAAETASKFNPDVKLVPHFANIMDTAQFPLKWFQSFDIVYNALDNKDARTYVNSMCLTGNVPLIETGTTGFRGQTQAIVAGATECFECNPKPTPKSFAVCTIRSTPSQPIHCIVWAKSYLFAQLFSGEFEDEVPDAQEAEENAEELEKLQKESNELKEIRDLIKSPEFAQKFFTKCFTHDIERLASIDTMWKTRKQPVPFSFEELKEQAGDYKSLAAEALKKDQSVWSIPETFAVLLDSTERLQARYSADTPLSFDKDDEDSLDFVAAAAILRSQIFSIELKSKFDIKQTAGNIIPAIATTNAIIAGLCVLQSFKVLKAIKAGKLKEAVDDLPTVFLSREPTHLISIMRAPKPYPDCVACSVTRVILQVDPAVTTVRHLVEDLIQNNWDYSDEFSLITSGLIYDPDFDDNLDRTLLDLGQKGESFVTVMDEADEPLANLELYIQLPPADDKQTAEDVQKYLSELAKPEFKTKYIAPKEDEDDDDGSDLEPVEDASSAGAGASTKRKAESPVLTPTKKVKVDGQDDSIEIVDLDGGDDEVIEID